MKQYCFLWLILLNSCSLDQTIHWADAEEREQLALFQSLPDDSRLDITEYPVKGEKLLLCLTLIHKDSQQPIPGNKVLFYQANEKGEYNTSIPGVESSAKINGFAVTNSEGRIFLETILPGDYGSTENNRHIHTTVYGANPEGYDLHFRQYANPGLKAFVNNSDQHFLVDLKYNRDSILLGQTIMEVKGME